MQTEKQSIVDIKKRFDGYLPIVVDVETSGVDPKRHALLEIAAMSVSFNREGLLIADEHFSTHVEAFEGATIDPKAMEINKIDPHHPFRFAIKEDQALEALFEYSQHAVKQAGCRRAVLVGHNAHFDLSFIQATMQRCNIRKSPFHAFTVIDTASLGALVYGKTVLAKILRTAKIKFDKNEAHSAVYDTQKTAELFCQMVNHQQTAQLAETVKG